MAEFDFQIIDTHAHPGKEKKDIEKRPGCVGLWIGSSPEDSFTKGLSRNMAIALGLPDPGIMNRPEDIPDLTVAHWIRFMDKMGISHMGLNAMDVESDPPASYRWLVPDEYVKEEFLDRYPDRFWAISGVHYKLPIRESLKQVEKAKELGFLGIKIFPPFEGYPNDRERCYPIYRKCLELDLHVEIHTGDEGVTGGRLKYCDPIFVDDIANDFPDLRIVQVHLGMIMGPEMAIRNCRFHRNVYADITGFFTRYDPRYPRFSDLFGVMEQQIPDKVWFGSDFPIWAPRYGQDLKNIKELPVSAQFKRKLLRDNAEKFYLKRGGL